MEGKKRITVRMLEAYFNALPILIGYMHKRAMIDPSAKRALKQFSKNIQKERPFVLDPSEAVFGFASMLSNLDPSLKFGRTENTTIIATLADEFCKINELSPPAPGYTKRLKMPKVGKNP